MKAKSRIVTDQMVANKELDINHIDFVIPPDDNENLKEYTQFISWECYIRGIPLIGSHLEDWRAALRCCICMENKIKFLQQVKEWSNSGRTTVPLLEVLELLIPCILHLENRSDEKIITTILWYGFSEFMGSSSSDASAKTFIASIQDVFQKQILGTVESPSQWKLWWSKDKDDIVIDHVQVRNQTD
jgi:hypothetical protein